MKDNSVPQQCYHPLMGMNQAAFQAGMVGTAYHALAGALHSARRVAEQRVWVDQNEPRYEHSTRPALSRNNERIGNTLSRQAEAMIQVRDYRRKLQSGGRAEDGT